MLPVEFAWCMDAKRRVIAPQLPPALTLSTAASYHGRVRITAPFAGAVFVALLAAPTSAFQNAPATPRKRPAPPTVQAPSSAKESADLRQQARTALRERHYDRAEAMLKAGLRIRQQAEREAWQIFECELALARDQATRAGLSAMRLVILTPDSANVGAALYWAAKSYEALGRTAKAKELYRECAAHKSTPKNVHDAATKRLHAISSDPTSQATSVKPSQRTEATRP